MADPADNKVQIVHPETGGTAAVSRRAFDEAHSLNGWVLAEGETPSEVVAEVVDPETSTGGADDLSGFSDGSQSDVSVDDEAGRRGRRGS